MIDYTNRLFAVVIVTFPIIEYITSVYYILNMRFYRPYLFYWGVLTLMLPTLAFIRYLSLDKEYPRVWYKWMNAFRWLKSHRGLPKAFGRPCTCFGTISFDGCVPGRDIYHNTLSVFSIIVLGPTWVILISLQILSWIPLVLILAMNFILLSLWFFVGVFLFQMKCFTSGSIWNGWLLIWTHGKNLKSSINFDVYFLQEALFSEYIFHTFPQLGFLAYNLYKEGGINASPIGLVNFVITSIMFVYGSYRFWVLYLCLSKDFYRVPFGPSWLVDSLYFEEELIREEQEEHMIGHEARLARRNVFTQSNPMYSFQQRQQYALVRHKIQSETNALIMSSEPGGAWDIVLKAKILLEQKSEFRELNKLESILHKFGATDSDSICKLRPQQIDRICTLIPDELVQSFDSLIPPEEIHDFVSKDIELDSDNKDSGSIELHETKIGEFVGTDNGLHGRAEIHEEKNIDNTGCDGADHSRSNDKDYNTDNHVDGDPSGNDERKGNIV